MDMNAHHKQLLIEALKNWRHDDVFRRAEYTVSLGHANDRLARISWEGDDGFYEISYTRALPWIDGINRELDAREAKTEQKLDAIPDPWKTPVDPERSALTKLRVRRDVPKDQQRADAVAEEIHQKQHPEITVHGMIFTTSIVHYGHNLGSDPACGERRGLTVLPHGKLPDGFELAEGATWCPECAKVCAVCRLVETPPASR